MLFCNNMCTKTKDSWCVLKKAQALSVVEFDDDFM